MSQANDTSFHGDWQLRAEPVAYVSEAVRQRAARKVCEMAEDAEEASTVLQALGLIDYRETP